MMVVFEASPKTYTSVMSCAASACTSGDSLWSDAWSDAAHHAVVATATTAAAVALLRPRRFLMCCLSLHDRATVRGRRRALLPLGSILGSNCVAITRARAHVETESGRLTVSPATVTFQLFR